ncbi:NADH dehydrogenase ubiquinone Fe-S protein 4, partial [Thalassospira sp. UBA4513]
MKVRVYKPAKNAMQSGQAATKHWVMEFEPGAKKVADQLMGWIGST